MPLKNSEKNFFIVFKLLEMYEFLGFFMLTVFGRLEKGHDVWGSFSEKFRTPKNGWYAGRLMWYWYTVILSFFICCFRNPVLNNIRWKYCGKCVNKLTCLPCFEWLFCGGAGSKARCGTPSCCCECYGDDFGYLIGRFFLTVIAFIPPFIGQVYQYQSYAWLIIFWLFYPLIFYVQRLPFVCCILPCVARCGDVEEADGQLKHSVFCPEWTDRSGDYLAASRELRDFRQVPEMVNIIERRTTSRNQSSSNAPRRLKTKQGALDEPHECAVCMLGCEVGDKVMILTCHQLHILHSDCLEMWQRTQEGNRRTVTCPYCRERIDFPNVQKLDITEETTLNKGEYKGLTTLNQKAGTSKVSPDVAPPYENAGAYQVLLGTPIEPNQTEAYQVLPTMPIIQAPDQTT